MCMTLIEPLFQNSISELLDFENPFKEYQKMAFEKLLKVGFPTSKNEAYKYMRISSLLSASYRKASLEKVDESLIEKAITPFKDLPYLLIYNGHFLPRYSNVDKCDPRIIIKPLYDAFYSYSVFFKNILSKWIEKETDPFALLNLSVGNEGVFIYAPSNVVQKDPIVIVEVNQGEGSAFAAPLVMTSIGKNSEVDFMTHFEKNTSPTFLNSSLYFYNLEENSKVKKIHHPAQKEGISFEAFRVYQKDHSYFKMVCANINSKKTRLDCNIQLLGKEANAEIISLSALKKNEEMHTHILVEHHQESGYSRQLVKNLYNDASVGSFDGKIYIHQEAQKTNAYQLNQNCLLSDQATSYSKPGLEIFADDVKASHGSTTGQIDKEHLFYLQSRGLSKEESVKLLLEAFCFEVLDEIKFKNLKDIVSKNLLNYFVSNDI